jgi:hypothetical protein
LERDSTSKVSVTNGHAYKRVRSEVEKAVNAVLGAKSRIIKQQRCGIYTAEHLAEERARLSAEAADEVQARLGAAAKSIEDARACARKELERLRKVDPAQLAATTVQLQMVLGNSLQDQPERLLGLYEAGFDNPGERRVVETLAQRLLQVMPDGASKTHFAYRWEERQRSLADKLPEEERRVLAELNELESVAENYLTPASKAMAYFTKRLAGEERGSSPDYDVRIERVREFDQAHGEQSPFAELPHTLGNQDAWRDL